MSDTNPRASIKLPTDLVFGQLRPDYTKPPHPLLHRRSVHSPHLSETLSGMASTRSSAPIVPLRQHQLPNPVPPPPPPRDNILELNLTSETLSFSKSLGSVPNRGTGAQPDAFLNGVPYLQTINDITIHGESVGYPLRTRNLDSCARRPPFRRWAKRSRAWPPFRTARLSRLKGSSTRAARATDHRPSGHHAVP